MSAIPPVASAVSAVPPAADTVPAVPTVREFFEFALERALDDYGKLEDTWKSLDVKAQGVTGIAGIFMAATYAFVKDGLANVTDVRRGLLTAAIALLFVAVAFSIGAMFARKTSSQASASVATTLAADLFGAYGYESSPDLIERYDRMLMETLAVWTEACGALHKVVREKSDYLLLAQSSLGFAAFFVLLLTLASIWSK